YGMLEPGEDCPLVGKDAIGLVLVPGLAFDPSGGRLGQGGGFYDRWLADYAGCTAALCRTALLLPQVPRAPHDRGVELVLTEHGLYRADAQRSGAQRPRSSPDGT
ncbi:MAG: 5-formyltetrahydrofolate cyclo-ligase, partial [Flavonifractor plautii]